CSITRATAACPLPATRGTTPPARRWCFSWTPTICWRCACVASFPCGLLSVPAAAERRRHAQWRVGSPPLWKRDCGSWSRSVNTTWPARALFSSFVWFVVGLCAWRLALSCFPLPTPPSVPALAGVAEPRQLHGQLWRVSRPQQRHVLGAAGVSQQQPGHVAR